MIAPGRDQGLGPAPRSRIQTRLVCVNKSQQRAAFGSRWLSGWAACTSVDGPGKLGYPGSRVIWQHDEPCLLSLGLKYWGHQVVQGQDSSLRES